MSVVDLELFKKHVRADDYSADDELLQMILDSAEVEVIRATNRTTDELKEIGGGDLPLPIKQAILMAGAMKFAYPEGLIPSSMQQIPFGVEALIKQYRKLESNASGEDEV